MDIEEVYNEFEVIWKKKKFQIPVFQDMVVVIEEAMEVATEVAIEVVSRTFWTNVQPLMIFPLQAMAVDMGNDEYSEKKKWTLKFLISVDIAVDTTIITEVDTVGLDMAVESLTVEIWFDTFHWFVKLFISH